MTGIRLPPRIITSGDSYLMSPKNDFAFKLLFGVEKNADLLLSLLRSILKEQIMSVSIKDPHLLREFFEDKEGVLDVRAVTNTGIQIDIEIQLTDYSAMPERILFYWSKMYSSHISSGDQYYALKKTISIAILDYECFRSDDLHSCFHLTDQEHGITLTDVLEVHILELPKLDMLKEQGKDNPLIQWMKFMNASSVEELIMISEVNPAIRKAYQTLEVLSKDEETRKVYEAREAVLLDRALMLQAAEKKGIAEGIERGIEKGIEEGIALERESVARNLISLGFDNNIISKATGLDTGTVKKLREASDHG